MNKIIICIFISLFSLSTFAQECADNVVELKTLVGNRSLAMKWKENTTKNPLFLTIMNNANGTINLALKTAKGNWAVASGIVCGKGTNYVAKIQDIKWGDEAPRLAKMVKVNQLKLELPYNSLLEVEVSGVKMEFSPNE